MIYRMNSFILGARFWALSAWFVRGDPSDLEVFCHENQVLQVWKIRRDSLTIFYEKNRVFLELLSPAYGRSPIFYAKTVQLPGVLPSSFWRLHAKSTIATVCYHHTPQRSHSWNHWPWRHERLSRAPVHNKWINASTGPKTNTISACRHLTIHPLCFWQPENIKVWLRKIVSSPAR